MPQIEVDEQGRPLLPEGWSYQGEDYLHTSGKLVKGQDLQSLRHNPGEYLQRQLYQPPPITPDQARQMAPKE